MRISVVITGNSPVLSSDSLDSSTSSNPRFLERMNTYQVHVVARRCMPVRDHACVVFLLLENARTAVCLNWPGISMAAGRDCYRPPSVWNGLILYETRSNRLITVGICSSIIVVAIARSRHSVMRTRLDFSLEVAGIIDWTTGNHCALTDELFRTCRSRFIKNTYATLDDEILTRKNPERTSVKYP